MLQCEPARHDSTARSRDLWTQSCEHLCFTESPLCFSCCLTPDTPLVTPGPIPPGQWILAPCGQLISTFWDSAGPIGIFMLGSDSPSACCFCSQWYWRGSFPPESLARMRGTAWTFALCFAAITVLDWK